MKIIRRILLIFTILFVVGTILQISLMVYLGTSWMLPSLKGTDIGIADFFKKEMDQEKVDKLENNLLERGETIIDKASAGFQKFVYSILFPGKDFSKSQKIKKQDPEEYMEKSNELLERMDRDSQKGLQEGLKIADDAEEERKKALDQGFEYLREMEEENKIIIEKALSE